MSLSKCIANFWGVGQYPPEESTLQIIEIVNTQLDTYFTKLHLSDGHSICSTFSYMNHRKFIPPKYSVIQLKNPMIYIVNNVNHIYFSQFVLVARNDGRIQRINNPFYIDTDPVMTAATRFLTN